MITIDYSSIHYQNHGILKINVNCEFHDQPRQKARWSNPGPSGASPAVVVCSLAPSDSSRPKEVSSLHKPCAALSNAHNHEQLHRLASQLKEQEMTITLWKKWEHTQSIMRCKYILQFFKQCRGLVILQPWDRKASVLHCKKNTHCYRFYNISYSMFYTLAFSNQMVLPFLLISCY